jgi:hypothetical protein
MDEPAKRVGCCHSQEPHDQEDDKNGPKHCFLLPLNESRQFPALKVAIVCPIHNRRKISVFTLARGSRCCDCPDSVHKRGPVASTSLNPFHFSCGTVRASSSSDPLLESFCLGGDHVYQIVRV